MRYLKYLTLIIGFNLSCNLFRQSVKTNFENKEEQDKTTSIKRQKESVIHKQEQSINFYKDSGRNDYAIRFWPKGDLKFTSGKGFSGQFDSILMTGKSLQESRGAMIKTASGQQKDNDNFDKEEKLSYNTSQKSEIKKSFGDYITIFLSLIFIVSTFLWGYKRVKTN